MPRNSKPRKITTVGDVQRAARWIEEVAQYRRDVKAGIVRCAVITCGARIERDSDGFNNQLCQRCWEDAGFENEHCDTGGLHYLEAHQLTTSESVGQYAAHPLCPICKAIWRDDERTARLRSRTVYVCNNELAFMSQADFNEALAVMSSVL